MKNSLSSLTTADLLKELNGIIGGAIPDQIVRASAILVELKGRKKYHPAMNSSILKWFKQVHEEKLSAEFVLVFSAFPDIITAVVGTPLQSQRKWAIGEDVDIVEPNVDGKLVAKKKPLLRFSKKDVKQVFVDGKVASLDKQRETLQKSQSASLNTSRKPIERITADPLKGQLIIGRSTYSIGELKEPLKHLGFRLSLIPKEEKAT